MSTHSAATTRRRTRSPRGTRSLRSRLRFLPVTGVLIATVLTATGCCVGYCTPGHAALGAVTTSHR